MEKATEQISKRKQSKGRGVDKSNHCHDEHVDADKTNPDHTSNLARLRKVEGQVKGIMKMIDEGRYCVDILIQFRAIASALNAIEMDIMEKHIQSCVTDAVSSKDKQAGQTKINELVKLISKRI